MKLKINYKIWTSNKTVIQPHFTQNQGNEAGFGNKCLQELAKLEKVRSQVQPQAKVLSSAFE